MRDFILAKRDISNRSVSFLPTKTSPVNHPLGLLDPQVPVKRHCETRRFSTAVVPTFPRLRRRAASCLFLGSVCVSMRCSATDRGHEAPPPLPLVACDARSVSLPAILRLLAIFRSVGERYPRRSSGRVVPPLALASFRLSSPDLSCRCRARSSSPSRHPLWSSSSRKPCSCRRGCLSLSLRRFLSREDLLAKLREGLSLLPAVHHPPHNGREGEVALVHPTSQLVSFLCPDRTPFHRMLG